MLLDHGETQQIAKVIRRSINSNGKVIGNLSGSLKTLMYDVEFPDGAVKQYAGNVIAEMSSARWTRVGITPST